MWYQVLKIVYSYPLSSLKSSQVKSTRTLVHLPVRSDSTMADRGISPPPSKRARLSAPTSLAPSTPARPITPLQDHQLRIFSWNVNGITRFLQPTITSFFSMSASSPPKKRTARSRSLDPESENCTGASRTSNDLRVGNGSASLQTCLERWNYPSIVCLQEVKIAPSDTKSQQSVRQIAKSCFSTKGGIRRGVRYTAHFSLPRDKFNARGFGGNGKVYGVITLVRNDLLDTESPTEHIKKPDWDLEGRVLLVELPEKKIVVFNVYAVNGTENPYRDPQTGGVVGTRHDRKRAFHSELAEECEKYEDQGWTVVIAGDINVARSALDGFPGIRLGEAHVRNRKDFERKFMKKEGGLGMVDSFRHMHGDERKYSYRSRGVKWGASCDRVDLILVSGKAVGGAVSGEEQPVRHPSIVEADVLDNELERGPSDHVPIYVTLNTGSFK